MVAEHIDGRFANFSFHFRPLKLHLLSRQFFVQLRLIGRDGGETAGSLEKMRNRVG